MQNQSNCEITFNTQLKSAPMSKHTCLTSAFLSRTKVIIGCRKNSWYLNEAWNTKKRFPRSVFTVYWTDVRISHPRSIDGWVYCTNFAGERLQSDSLELCNFHFPQEDTDLSMIVMGGGAKTKFVI